MHAVSTSWDIPYRSQDTLIEQSDILIDQSALALFLWDRMPPEFPSYICTFCPTMYLSYSTAVLHNRDH